eukprot:745731-Hanusia_phi.AAC.5
MSGVNNSSDRCAALLISWRASINLVDDVGETPLIKAASNGNTHLVKHLLSKGARTDLVDSAGFSALRRATFEGHEDVVKILIGGHDSRLAQPSVKQIIAQLGLADLPDLVSSLRDGLSVHDSLSSSLQHRRSYNLAGRVWNRMLSSWGVGGLVLHPPARRQKPTVSMAAGRSQLDGNFFRRSGEDRMREVKELAEAAETCRHLPRWGIDGCKPRISTRDLDLKAALEEDARVPCDSLCVLERLAPLLSGIWRKFTKRKRLMSCRTREHLLLHIMRFGERLRQIEYENASIVISPQTLYGEEAEDEFDDCGGDCDEMSRIERGRRVRVSGLREERGILFFHGGSAQHRSTVLRPGAGLGLLHSNPPQRRHCRPRVRPAAGADGQAGSTGAAAGDEEGDGMESGIGAGVGEGEETKTGTGAGAG